MFLGSDVLGLAKEILKTHDIAFASRPELNVPKILGFESTNKGPIWVESGFFF